MTDKLSPATSEKRDPLLPNALTIARREYFERVRSRLFGVSTLLLATLAVIVAMSPVILRALDSGSVTRVAIVAQEARVGQIVVESLGGMVSIGSPGGSPSWRLTLVSSLDVVKEGDYDAAMIVTRETSGRLNFDLRTTQDFDASKLLVLQTSTIGVGLIDAANRANLSAEAPTLTTTAIDGPNAGGKPISSSDYASRRIVGIVFVVLIFITLVIYGMWVAAGVVAEKSSRVMELLISAASARQLVVGKVLGIGAAGATQYAFIIACALLALVIEERVSVALLGPSGSVAPSLVALSPGLLLAFAGFFVLGFTLYALIYAAAGSLVSRPEDLQIIALPLSLIAIAGYFQAVLALSGGSAGFIRFASYVPFWSPFVMLTRLSIGRVEAWEVGLSFGLLIVTIGIVGVIAVRVYAAGVLLYGQRPGFRAYVAAARHG
jgi:ABC-2 type transport system permease protein